MKPEPSSFPGAAAGTDRPLAYHHGDLRRALVEAALALATEEQRWDFSLREVARRAGVSHNAPYRHFSEKRDLLAAVAVAGFDALRARLAAAAEETEEPEAALVATGVAYIGFGTENPARYRLMFGPALFVAGAEMPSTVAQAGAAAKAVLARIIACGVRAKRFAVSADTQAEQEGFVLTAWSLVHGLTMLLIDGRAGDAVPSSLPETVARILLDGIRKR